MGILQRSSIHKLSVSAIATLILSLGAISAVADINVAILPAHNQISPGAMFDVEVAITAEGDAFNGYDALITFDPNVLTFIQRPQSEQEGPLMTEACGNRFHVFEVSPTGDVLSISHVLLCAAVEVSGPGVLYRLRFQASETITVTDITLLEGTGFYLAGSYVTPVVTQSARVYIDPSTAVPSEVPQTGLNLQAAPNPFNPRTEVSFLAPEAGWADLAVFTPRGARIRNLWSGRLGSGWQQIEWDGRDDSGRSVGSGTYLVQLNFAGRRELHPVTLLK